MKKKYICFVAGRSGGHIVPALTLAQDLKHENPENNIIFFSTKSGVDKSLLQNHQTLTRWIPLNLANFPRKKLYRYPQFLWHLTLTFFKSLFYLIRYRPEKLIAMGGYISIPVCLAAWILQIPQELFELNVIPGKATTFLKPFVPQIAICFKQAKKYLPTAKCYNAPYPVRFPSQTLKIPRKEALAAMTFLTARSTIMILGGSQGSAFLNNIIKKWIELNPAYHSKIQIIHQTGLLHDKYDLEDFYTKYKIPAFVFDYFDELENCYRAANLIICRSGAGTLFEVKFFNKPCITIPLHAKTTGHQYHNAQAMKELSPLFTVMQQHEIEKSASLLDKSIRNCLQKR